MVTASLSKGAKLNYWGVILTIAEVGFTLAEPGGSDSGKDVSSVALLV